MKCKHLRTTGWMWRSNSVRELGYAWSYGFVQPGDTAHHGRVVCDVCGHSLSLGPARDDGPHAAQVAVEIAAARLIAGFEDANDTDDTLNDPLCMEVLAHMLGASDRRTARGYQVFVIHEVARETGGAA